MSPENAESSDHATALVVVDHGSRNEAANRVVEELAADLRRQTGTRFVAVEPAHMELAQPDLGAAVEACQRAGAQKIVVAPFFLAPGRHSTRDIPAMAAEQARRYPDLEILVASPLGNDPLMTELILARAAAALDAGS